jgi:hypothetical protein
MRKTVTHYYKTCATCQRIGVRTTKPLGSLFPLPKATLPWKIISIDFITGLSVVDGYDCITTFMTPLQNKHTSSLAQFTLALHNLLASSFTTFTDTIAFAAVSFRIATLNLPRHFGEHFSNLCNPN